MDALESFQYDKIGACGARLRCRTRTIVRVQTCVICLRAGLERAPACFEQEPADFKTQRRYQERHELQWRESSSCVPFSELCFYYDPKVS